MLFKNLWVDPQNVIAVFSDCEFKRARVLLKEPPMGEVICDDASAQELMKHLEKRDNSAKPKMATDSRTT